MNKAMLVLLPLLLPALARACDTADADSLVRYETAWVADDAASPLVFLLPSGAYAAYSATTTPAAPPTPPAGWTPANPPTPATPRYSTWSYSTTPPAPTPAPAPRAVRTPRPAPTPRAAAAPGEGDETVKKSVPARGNAVVIVHNPNGSIRLIGWSRPEVAISCTLDRSMTRLRASGLDDSSEIRIEVEPRGGQFGPGMLVFPTPGGSGSAGVRRPVTAQDRERLKALAELDRLKASAPSRPSRESASGEEDEEDAFSGPGAPEADLEVYVPRLARLTVETFGADVNTSGLVGTVDVSSLSGDMQLEGQFRRIDAECVSCEIEAGSTSEAFKASTVSGNITLALAKGYVELNTVSGDVDLTGRQVTQASFTSVSGNIAYKGDVVKDGALYFETHSGAIDLRLTPNLGAEFDLSSITGEVSSDLPVRESQPLGNRGGRQFRFTTGAGGARISAKSFGGDITVTTRKP